MANRCTYIPQIMLPREGCDLSKWAVIACDQYTSQPEYWAEADRIRRHCTLDAAADPARGLSGGCGRC